MLQELWSILPPALTNAAPLWAGAASVAGAALWLAGGRFARSVFTLAAVAAGAWVGMRLPRWCGWSIDGAGVGVTAALVLGASAYFMDRLCTGVLLGATLAAWATAAVWAGLGDGRPLALPAVKWTGWGDSPLYLAAVWQALQSLPGDVGKVAPYACAAGLASGILVAVLWPKAGRCLLFSVLGLSPCAVMGLPALARIRPDWVACVPAGHLSQGLVLLGLIAVGFLIQWRLIPKTPLSPIPPGPKGSSHKPGTPERLNAQTGPVRSVQGSGARPRVQGAPERPHGGGRPVEPVRNVHEVSA